MDLVERTCLPTDEGITYAGNLHSLTGTEIALAKILCNPDLCFEFRPITSELLVDYGRMMATPCVDSESAASAHDSGARTDHPPSPPAASARSGRCKRRPLDAGPWKLACRSAGIGPEKLFAIMDGDISDGGDNGDTRGEAAGSDLDIPRSARGSSSAHHRDGVAVDHDQQTRPTQLAQFDSS